ncbi:50S ribosomal protein L25 [Candidatus Nitrospira inopinata]|jgi:large subunit ribosomal protein L25|uniref:Large ribosomal subunit protein bL25 n=1 Tax=Candidatus Nitrospira inopinata TaxID=1715989 RepID=A0A0S4KLH9_9BACT|nr:50S ribosomal protein L25 [Candidatus Nitrospira inopinata]CUQ65251.1 50S ribosomal protein L25 [Candidatus Nitrospira inopinata]
MKFELAATVREQAGKGVARAMRRAGKIPAVLYGQGECMLLSVSPTSLMKILKSHAGSSALIALTIEGAKSNPNRTALLRDYQLDPVSGTVLHADLFEVSMSKPIRVKVPIQVVGGTPVGVKEGGVLHHNLRELYIECLPSALPDHIEVDASALTIGSGIHVKELTVSEGIRLLDDAEQMVVSVAAPLSDAKLEALLTSGAAAGAEPEVIAKGKEAAGEGAGAEAAKAGAAAGEGKAAEKKEAAPKAEKKEAEKKK